MTTQPDFQPLPPYQHTDVWDGFYRPNGARVMALAFSPDSRFLACPFLDNKVRLWEVESGIQVRTLTGHTDSVISVVFSPNTRHIASTSADNTVRLSEVLSGAHIATLRGHSRNVHSAAFSPNGALLASASGDLTVRLWETAKWEHVVTFETEYGYENMLYSVAFSPDGACVAAGSLEGVIFVWEVKSRYRLARLKGHSNTVKSVQFSPDSALLASGSHDGTIRLWDIVSRTEVTTFRKKGGKVFSATFSPDGTVLASGHRGGVEVWDVASRSLISTLVDDPRGDCGFYVAFSPNGSLLAAGGPEGTVRLWKCSLGRKNEQVITDIIGINMLQDEAPTVATATSTSFTEDLEDASVDNDISGLVTLVSNNRIAGGGFGEMFLGTHTDLGKVAMKRPHNFFNEASLRRFLREVGLWRMMFHRYILPCLGTCKIGRDVYMVSPFIENGDLMSCIKRGMSLNRSRLLYEVAEALAHLHHRGIVHGDVKAQNILVADDGSALLCDFGLAKAFDTMETSSDAKGAGSMRWMPPEMFHGAGRSMATDVYSFGITIAEVLSGLLPFHHLSESVAVMVHLLTQNGRPAKEPATSPEGKSYSILWETAEKCWAAEAKARPYMAQVLGMLFSLNREHI